MACRGIEVGRDSPKDAGRRQQVDSDKQAGVIQVGRQNQKQSSLMMTVYVPYLCI
jgi:hypothetical protein